MKSAEMGKFLYVCLVLWLYNRLMALHHDDGKKGSRDYGITGHVFFEICFTSKSMKFLQMLLFLSKKHDKVNGYSVLSQCFLYLVLLSSFFLYAFTDFQANSIFSVSKQVLWVECVANSGFMLIDCVIFLIAKSKK